MAINATPSPEQVLSDDELAYLGTLFRPRRRRLPWRKLLAWLLLALAAVAVFCYAFWRYSLSIDHFYQQRQGILFAQAPSPAILAAAKALPEGSLVARFDEQWVACSPHEEGWLCQSLELP
ncbi:hypothetical protein PVT67_17070 [Gallaecimonas kandeliae]|uniref:hypothetical protein n=1 Tax=Gallaecimonas kandeliae TaxID=3029055 RepID=UPI0026496D81|nr:hypothetical protein [Gallaecimonas kandeliae]WKE65354.1 hypothetical protein PVT67_17070 [Gallaecimonas kandeliae]